MRRIKIFLSLLLPLLMLLIVSMGAYAATAEGIDAAISDTAAYIYQTVEDPQVGSVGGEWAIIGLSRSGYQVDGSYFQSYYVTVEQYVESLSRYPARKEIYGLLQGYFCL